MLQQHFVLDLPFGGKALCDGSECLWHAVTHRFLKKGGFQMPTMEERIRQAIRSGLAPVHFEIVDESSLHAGHAGARPGGETHYRITVISEKFEGVSRVRRQQMVYALLDDAFAAGLHALAMTTRTPSEAGQ